MIAVAPVMRRDDVYRSMREAGEILKYRGPHASACARQFLRKHGVPFYSRGRAVLVHIDDIHEVLSTGECVVGLERRQGELERHTSPRALRAVSGGQR